MFNYKYVYIFEITQMILSRHRTTEFIQIDL